ncbi:MAG: 1,4-alpha-glucan-branching enzyme, partial [Desulfosarcina sp.]|nr:1,4-alpha-glucan-branching enzyme [Desulfobacterales bacterium]
MNNNIKKPYQDIVKTILEKDPFLTPYADSITNRILTIRNLKKRLTCDGMSLRKFASGHEYFGLHLYDNRHNNEWILREWAPSASEIYLVGDLSNWQEKEDFKLK